MRSDALYLAEILDALEAIERFVKGRKSSAFATSPCMRIFLWIGASCSSP